MGILPAGLHEHCKGGTMQPRPIQNASYSYLLPQTACVAHHRHGRQRPLNVAAAAVPSQVNVTHRFHLRPRRHAAVCHVFFGFLGRCRLRIGFHRHEGPQVAVRRQAAPWGASKGQLQLRWRLTGARGPHAQAERQLTVVLRRPRGSTRGITVHIRMEKFQQCRCTMLGAILQCCVLTKRLLAIERMLRILAIHELIRGCSLPHELVKRPLQIQPPVMCAA